MTILEQLASAAGQRVQDLNIALAQQIAATKDKKAVQELIAGLEHKTKALRHDCIKTIYEVAALQPGLASPYVQVFLALLDSKDNRLQWGAMTTLSAIAAQVPAGLYQALPRLVAIADAGSVITRDHLVRILVSLAGIPAYASDAVPLLLEQLLQAPVNQVPAYAEQAMPVIPPTDKEKFRQVLHTRLNDIEQESKRKRIEKVLKKLKP
ncbi:hypothetical protein [Taibaiella koreensis]|uniref:hypothetical protein n=1 Tax=Taibaiella koreensis TaxID=1268548 RepID=UPI000E59C19D|nr:hypothetical protein [Taibaiella koreensis]